MQPDCEFAACPTPEDKTYASHDMDECQVLKLTCQDNELPFYADDGCGCKIDPVYKAKCGEGREYVGKNEEECSTVMVQCIPPFVPFNDECGCGCESG
mgnify:CR=1 FL=1